MNTTSSIKIFEQRNTEYRLGNELRFIIPKSVMAINPIQSYICMNIEVDSALHNAYCLNEQCGAELIVKQLRILSEDGSAVYEELSDYNKIKRVLSYYGNNKTDDNLNKLFQGGQDPAPILLGKNKLFDTDENGNITQKKLPVQFKLSLSGLLGMTTRPFPNVLSGLQIIILLENDINKVLRKMGEYKVPRQLTIKGDQSKDVFGKVVGYSPDCAYQVAAITDKDDNIVVDGTDAGLEFVKTLHINTHGVNANGADDDATIVAGDAFQILNSGGNGLSQSVSPFKIGQTISFFKNTDNGGSSAFKIHTMSRSADGRLLLTCNPTDFPNGVDLRAGAENNNNLLVSKVAILEPNQFAATTGFQPASTLLISNVEFVVGTINLKPEEISKIQSASSSSTGYMQDIQSYLNYPVNITKALVNSIFIPTKLNRCKSVISFYESVGGQVETNRDNLLPIIDSHTAPRKYNYKLDNLIVPNRQVSLTNLNKAPAVAGALSSIHLHELQKGLQSSTKVRSLEAPNMCFTLARQLAVMNHTYDANRRSEMRLDLDFEHQDRDLLVHNFIHHIRRIIISAKGIMVEM